MLLSRPLPKSKPINVDIKKAKILHLETLRKIRAPILEDLDKTYLWADEHRNDDAQRDLLKKEIIAIKNKVRDATEIPLPDNVDELKSFIPEPLQYRYKIPKNEK